MGLSKSSKSLWDPIRCIHVEATPEEVIRQRWLLRMMGPLGYPKGLLSIEKEISFQRRIDILCYYPKQDELKPLLLVECKAKGDFATAKQQVFGYNEVLGAPFLCTICEDQAHTFWKEPQGIVSIPFLPSYAQLQKYL